MLKPSTIFSLVPCAILLCACGSDDAATIEVRAYGESFIEEGIPAADVNDGWAISFNRFAVDLRDIIVAGQTVNAMEPVDLSVPSAGIGHEVGRVSAEHGTRVEPTFTIAGVEIEGAAERDGVVKTFRWAFDAPTHYDRCETELGVADEETAVLQITVHADHLFYDSLVAAEPSLLFRPIADADADGDGEVTEQELGAVGIGAYDPGNEDVSDLWSWLIAQSRSLGHVDGEGHCQATARD